MNCCLVTQMMTAEAFNTMPIDLPPAPEMQRDGDSTKVTDRRQAWNIAGQLITTQMGMLSRAATVNARAHRTVPKRLKMKRDGAESMRPNTLPSGQKQTVVANRPFKRQTILSR
jgi:hypothetical protein